MSQMRYAKLVYFQMVECFFVFVCFFVFCFVLGHVFLLMYLIHPNFEIMYYFQTLRLCIIC